MDIKDCHVGDIVIGNELANIYSITRLGVKCEIVNIMLNQKIRVKTIEGNVIGWTFTVEAKRFDLVTSSVVPSVTDTSDWSKLFYSK